MTDPNDARRLDPGRIAARSIDPERMAALIDGKLNDAERAALMAELDASPDNLEVFADAVAALRDDDAGEEPAEPPAPTVIPITARRRRWIYAAIGSIAAALIVVAGLPLLRGPAGSPNSAEALVALLERPNDAASLTATAPWSELRGGDEGVASRSRAVRIGVRMVDLEVLLRVGDTANASRVARLIAAGLDAIPAGSVGATAYRTIADSPTSTADARKTAASFAEQLAGTENVRLGVWLEAARMAAASRDSVFFTKASADGTLPTGPNLPQGSAASLEQLRQLLRAPSLDWVAIQTAIGSILREVAAPGA